jgi:hypothetical protein
MLLMSGRTALRIIMEIAESIVWWIAAPTMQMRARMLKSSYKIFVQYPHKVFLAYLKNVFKRF